MNIHTAFSKYFYFPVYRKTRGKAWSRELSAFRQKETLGYEEIKQIQWQKLKILISHAYENVPYYRGIMDQLSIVPEDIKSEEDFKKMPVLTKSDINKNFNSMIAQNINKKNLFMNSSGGSTGVSLNFYQDSLYNQKRIAGVYWGNALAGLNLGDPVAYIWGVDDVRAGSRRDAMHRFLKNELILNCFNMRESDMLEFYKKLSALKIEFIIGYANALYLFFKYLKSNKLKLSRVKSVISSAEVLDSRKRRFLEEECALNVFNRYGAREAGLISAECEAHNGMHVFTDGVYTEIIERPGLEHDEGEDNCGDIVVTSLINYAMPFIRYRIEDIGCFAQNACSCGRGLPRLKSVIGRSTSIFTTADGRLMHGEYFTHLFYGLKEVEKFQFVQKDKKHYILKIVPSEGFNQTVLSPVLDKIKKALHTGDVDVQLVNAIEPAKSGKYMFTVSEVPLEI